MSTEITAEVRAEWRAEAEHFQQVLDTPEGREREGIVLTLLDALERAEAERDEAVAKVARVEALFADLERHYTSDGFFDGCCIRADDLRAALDTPATEGGE